MYLGSSRGLTRLHARYWLGMGSPPGLRVLLQAHVVLGRIHFLTAVDSWHLASARPPGRRVSDSQSLF